MATNIVQMTDGTGNKQYPVTSAEAVGMPDGSGNLTNYLDKRVTEYNVSVLHPTSGSGGSNKYTLETAIAQVPSKYRSVGIKCAFINANEKYECWKYNGGTWTVDSFSEIGDKKIIQLENKLKLVGKLQYIGSNYYEASSSVIKTFKMPNIVSNKKITLVLKSEDGLTATRISIKFNSKTLFGTYNFNLAEGFIVEFTPDEEDIKNNNQSNILEVSLQYVSNAGNMDSYFLYDVEEQIDINQSSLNTVVRANVQDIELTKNFFNDKVYYDLKDGHVYYAQSGKSTPILKLGTTKDVTIPSAITQTVTVVAFDINKKFKYFVLLNYEEKERYIAFTREIEYIAFSQATVTPGIIIHNVPIEYNVYNERNLQLLTSCPSRIFTNDEFFNTIGTNIQSSATTEENASYNSRLKLDVRDYVGIQISNRYLCSLYEYDKKGNCVAYYNTQDNAPVNWYVRGAVVFNPETAYISLSNHKGYKTNIILYKRPTFRTYTDMLANVKYSRDGRIRDWKVCGDSTSDEGWAGKEVDYWTMTSRILALQAEKNAKAASSFLPLKSGSAPSNTSIYDKTKLISDFNGLITVSAGTNDYGGGWDGSVWAPSVSLNSCSKLMLTQSNSSELFKELSVKKFEDLLNIDELFADRDNHYFEEAFLYTMWDLKKRNPQALIVCIAPFGRIGEEYPNPANATLQDYRKAEQRICQLLGIPFLDFQEVVGGINDTFYFKENENPEKPEAAAEGLHPDEQGHKIAAAWLIVKLRQLIDMWELMNNGYIDCAYLQGPNNTIESGKMFVREEFELKDFV